MKHGWIVTRDLMDRGEAAALVWKGHLKDVTDMYPDLELTIGPRGGVQVSPC